MAKGILFFLLVSLAVFLIGYFGVNSSREQRYSALKVLFVSVLCATVALVLVALIVFIF